MIEPYPATYVVLSFLAVWAILIPVLGAIPKVKDVISFRYLIVVVFLACMIGVVVNFDGLQTELKMAVIISAAVLSGIFILIRSLEKAMQNGWTLNKDFSATLKKGDAKAEVRVKEHDAANDDDKAKDDDKGE